MFKRKTEFDVEMFLVSELKIDKMTGVYSSFMNEFEKEKLVSVSIFITLSFSNF